MSDSSVPEATGSASGAPATSAPAGSRDGDGAGDHDEPFLGYRTYHFSTWQMMHLLHLRSDILDARLGRGRFAEDLAA